MHVRTQYLPCGDQAMVFLCAAPYWYTGAPVLSIRVVWQGIVPAAITNLRVKR